MFAALGYVSALLVAHYLLPEGWLPYCALAFALSGAAVFFIRRTAAKALALSFLAAAVGFFWLDVYTAWTVLPAERFAGETRTVQLLVTAYPELHDDYDSVVVRSIDGEVPHVRMVIYDYACGLEDLRPGDKISVELKLTSAMQRYREESDYYLAGGVHLRGTIKGEYTLTGRSDFAFLFFPQKLAEQIKKQAMLCFPADVAPLMKALLTGDKTEYYADETLYSAMRTSGFTHIIAISGMHVAFIVSLLGMWSGRRRQTAFLGVPLVLIFMAMVGFTPSVTRAGIMQILLLIAPVLRREDDPITSLSAVALLMLAVNPIAIASVSFQLSFAAMAGLILLRERVYRWCFTDENGKYAALKGNKLSVKFKRSICGMFAASVGALAFTTPIAALHFGYVPVYGILTTFLCLWAMSTAFLYGYLVCLLGAVWQMLGVAAGWILGWLPRYTIFMVEHIARLPNAVVYTNHNLGAWWLVFVYCVLIVSYLLRGGRRYRPAIPVCACIITLSLLSFVQVKPQRAKLEIAAVDVGQGMAAVALTEKGTVMIDCGSTGSPENAGDAAADYLLSHGRSRVDLLVLTHFHADHANGVTRLMSRVDVERIAIPVDCERNEYSEKILDACGKQGIEVFYIEDNTDVRIDTLALTLYAPLGSADVNEHCLLVQGRVDDFDFLLTGDAGENVEKLLTSFYAPGDMELLFAGHHGSKSSTGAALLDAVTPEYAFLSVGANNTYGHPAAEVLERLEARNIEIHRTDLEGTVSLRIGETNG